VAPKRVAIAHAERLAPIFAVLLGFWIRALAPLCLLLDGLARWLRPSLRPERKTLSDEELRTAVELSAEQGALDEEERTMVDGILRLSEMQVSDVMTPRVDMVGIDLDDPPAAHLALARRTRHRYLPVYRGSPDAIEGMLDVTRFLLEPAHDARHVTTPALFVPETATLDDMLITLQRSDRHIACVLDEYGGTAGLISRGDILGHITGELHQGPAAETPALTPAGEDRWLIDGNTSLDEINHALDLELEAEGADRIAGWVSAQAGRFPRAGEIIEAQGCRVLVRRMRKLRIEQVMLELLRRPDETGADAAQVREDEPL
jgi:putative hemolysin